MKKIISFALRKIPRKTLQTFSHHALKVFDILYRGNKMQCPISGKTYRKFLPYGRINPRPNALCPGSLSLERHRLMWLYLQNRTDFFDVPKKVLHVAPELCFLHKFESMRNLDYITADLESPLAKVKMDLHHIPFDENTFDVVFCNHVMEHVEDDIQCMREIYRVLKPNGWAIIQSPVDLNMPKTYEDKSITDPLEREKAFGQDDHLRAFGADYPVRLKAAGFAVTEDDFVKTLSKEQIKWYALPENEIIYFCKKTASPNNSDAELLQVADFDKTNPVLQP